MSSIQISSNAQLFERRGHLDDATYRGHAFSFLVATSVLLGSMFTAHSAIVELASIDAGSRMLAFVEGVRSEVLEIPAKASRHMASVASSYDPELFNVAGAQQIADRYSFSSGLEGLFTPYLTLVPSQDVPAQPQEPVFIAVMSNKGGNIDQPSLPQPVEASPVTSFLTAASEPYVALSIALLRQLDTAEEVITGLYVESIYAWVNTSSYVASEIVMATYYFGDISIEAIAYGIPTAEKGMQHGIAGWSEVARIMARKTVAAQLAVGDAVLLSMHSSRAASASIQQEAGEELATIIGTVLSPTLELAALLPKTATAAVADFLVLEQK